MASSVVEIWNLGLVRIGEELVVDEAEDSAQADILRTVWPTQRDRMLEEFDWDFARRYGALTLINDDTELVDGWVLAYEWPQGDLLAFRGIVNPIATAVERIPYDVMLRASGNDTKIMSDLGDAIGMWTERITEVERYPASFVYALSFALQAEVVGSINRNSNDQIRASQFLKQASELAKVATAKQAEPRTPEDTSPRSIAARA